MVDSTYSDLICIGTSVGAYTYVSQYTSVHLDHCCATLSQGALCVLTLFITTLKLVTVAICLVLGVNVSLFFRLKMYVQARFDHVKVFMKVEGRKANSVR